MKNTKWIKIVLGVLLALIVLTAVGAAGFRLGVMQSVKLTAGGDMPFPLAHMRGFDGDFARGFDHGRDFGGRGFGMFGFVFGLIRLAVLAGLVWIGYTFFKRSGWKLVKAEAAPAHAPAPSQTVVEEAPSADEGDEKKESV